MITVTVVLLYMIAHCLLCVLKTTPVATWMYIVLGLSWSKAILKPYSKMSHYGPVLSAFSIARTTLWFLLIHISIPTRMMFSSLAGTYKGLDLINFHVTEGPSEASSVSSIPTVF